MLIRIVRDIFFSLCIFILLLILYYNCYHSSFWGEEKWGGGRGGGRNSQLFPALVCVLSFFFENMNHIRAQL